jgi:DNA-binding transcriptional ArsR family regulator
MEIKAAVRLLGALAHETRLQLFRTLVRAGGPVSAGKLAEVLDVLPTTLSFHLKELKAAEAIVCRREGRSLLYAANFAGMSTLATFLAEDCCGGLR